MSNGFPDFHPQMHSELFRVTDEVRKLNAQPSALTWDDYSKLMSELCMSLTQSLKYGLEDAIRYLGVQAKNPQTLQDANSIVRDTEKFLAFVNFEERGLRQCNVPEATVTDMIDCLKSIREKFKENFLELDADGIIKNIKTLRDAACKASGDVEKRLAQKKENYEIDKLGLKIYGTGFVTANLAMLAWTLGASAIPSSASATLGGLLMVWEGKLRDPGKKRPK